MRALSVRQPYAELILRGIKTVEYRSRATKIIGERFLIYASKGRSQKPGARSQKDIWSRDLGGVQPPRWMVELAEQVGMIEAGALLPRGVIVGSAVIEKVTAIRDSKFSMRKSMYAWHLTEVERFDRPRKARGHPQPVWWRPS